MDLLILIILALTLYMRNLPRKNLTLLIIWRFYQIGITAIPAVGYHHGLYGTNLQCAKLLPEVRNRCVPKAPFRFKKAQFGVKEIFFN